MYLKCRWKRVAKTNKLKYRQDTAHRLWQCSKQAKTDKYTQVQRNNEENCTEAKKLGFEWPEKLKFKMCNDHIEELVFSLPEFKEMRDGHLIRINAVKHRIEYTVPHDQTLHSKSYRVDCNHTSLSETRSTKRYKFIWLGLPKQKRQLQLYSAPGRWSLALGKCWSESYLCFCQRILPLLRNGQIYPIT